MGPSYENKIDGRVNRDSEDEAVCKQQKVHDCLIVNEGGRIVKPIHLLSTCLCIYLSS